ncbi:TIR domain-containing protein [Cryomorphaceae bacterium 1068]|nr:TIR domain-containing protein [Cryomorphaceae bacterium 1068]
MAKKKVFISYDYDNDRHFKNLLLAWDGNRQFDFSISDHSADVSINSTRATTIKAVLSRKINECSRFLIIVGKSTYRSNWVNWEIEKAHSLGKKIIAVKTDRSNTTPLGLYGIGVSWAMSFTHLSITNAINNA